MSHFFYLFLQIPFSVSEPNPAFNFDKQVYRFRMLPK